MTTRFTGLRNLNGITNFIQVESEFYRTTSADALAFSHVVFISIYHRAKFEKKNRFINLRVKANVVVFDAIVKAAVISL